MLLKLEFLLGENTFKPESFYEQKSFKCYHGSNQVDK